MSEQQKPMPEMPDWMKDAGDLTKLNPELRACVFEGEFGPMIKHPLVIQIGVILPQQANDQLKHKRERIGNLVKEGKFTEAIWYFERPYRMTTVSHWFKTKQLDRDGLRRLLPGVWRDTEFPHQFGRTPAYLFRSATPPTLIDEAEGGFPWLPGETLEVFRGGTGRGISWTLDRKKAEWFAKRFLTDGKTKPVWRATVNANDVWAYFAGRGESEVVVDPRWLRDKASV